MVKEERCRVRQNLAYLGRIQGKAWQGSIALEVLRITSRATLLMICALWNTVKFSMFYSSCIGMQGHRLVCCWYNMVQMVQMLTLEAFPTIYMRRGPVNAAVFPTMALKQTMSAHPFLAFRCYWSSPFRPARGKPLQGVPHRPCL